MNPQSDERDRLDRATRHRLAKLAEVPADTSSTLARFHAAVSAEKQSQQPETRRLRFPLWKRLPAWTAMAAILTLAATLLLVLSNIGPSPVYAAPSEMVQMHRDLVAGKAPVIPVGNVDEARRTIEAQWQGAPALPTLPDKNVHACCLRDVQSRQVACVLLRQGGFPVTVIVARTKDFKSTDGPKVTRNGHEYSVHSRDGINMVMTQHQDRWLCFMSELGSDDLIELAESVASKDVN